MGIFNRKKEKIAEVIFDLSDIKSIGKYRWSSTYDGYNRYATGCVEGKLTPLHIYLLGRKTGLVIDHINRNSLDNRRSNLRFVTPSENVMNSKSRRKISRGAVVGVYYDKTNKKWIALTKYINGKRKCLKVSPYRKDAVNARMFYEKSLLTSTSR